MDTLLLSQIKNQDSIRFMLAGNAHVTFRNNETGNRYTFKIRLSKDKRLYFVSVLYGSCNDSDYSYIGIISNKLFRWTTGSKLKQDDIRVRVFDYVYNHLLVNKLPDCVEIWHEGRCGRCGRLLTVPESIESGIGPECARMM